MGCSAAKNLTIEPMDNNTKVTQLTNGTHEIITTKITSPLKVSNVPPLNGVDPQEELLENGKVNNVHQTSNGLSFDIPLIEEESESIIKKHPPKRFQKLEDQPSSPTVSLLRLQEKLDEAEVRRQQILLQRVQSAQIKKVLKKQPSVYSINEDDVEVEHLEVPLEKPGTPFVTNLGFTHKKNNLLS